MINEATNNEKQECSLQNDNCRNEFFNTGIKSINQCPRYIECVEKKVENRKNLKAKEYSDRIAKIKLKENQHAAELLKIAQQEQEEENKMKNSFVNTISSIPSNTVSGTTTLLNNTGNVLSDIGNSTSSLGDSVYTNVGLGNLFGKSQNQKDYEINQALQKLNNLKQDCTFSKSVSQCQIQKKPEIINTCKELISLGNIPETCKYVRASGGKKSRVSKQKKLKKLRNTKKTKKIRKTRKQKK